MNKIMMLLVVLMMGVTQISAVETPILNKKQIGGTVVTTACIENYKFILIVNHRGTSITQLFADNMPFSNKPRPVPCDEKGQ